MFDVDFGRGTCVLHKIEIEEHNPFNIPHTSLKSRIFGKFKFEYELLQVMFNNSNLGFCRNTGTTETNSCYWKTIQDDFFLFHFVFLSVFCIRICVRTRSKSRGGMVVCTDIGKCYWQHRKHKTRKHAQNQKFLVHWRTRHKPWANGNNIGRGTGTYKTNFFGAWQKENRNFLLSTDYTQHTNSQCTVLQCHNAKMYMWL